MHILVVTVLKLHVENALAWKVILCQVIEQADSSLFIVILMVARCKQMALAISGSLMESMRTWKHAWVLTAVVFDLL